MESVADPEREPLRSLTARFQIPTIARNAVSAGALGVDANQARILQRALTRFQIASGHFTVSPRTLPRQACYRNLKLIFKIKSI
jgi:hypothetical protein